MLSWVLRKASNNRTGSRKSMLQPARGSSLAIPSNHSERSRASSQTSAGSSASQDSAPIFVLALITSQSSLASNACGDWYPTTFTSSSERTSALRSMGGSLEFFLGVSGVVPEFLDQRRILLHYLDCGDAGSRNTGRLRA